MPKRSDCRTNLYGWINILIHILLKSNVKYLSVQNQNQRQFVKYIWVGRIV